MRTTCPLALLGVLLTGCANKPTFQATVHNNLDVPITVGFIKDGPPVEREWLTVEQMAMGAPLDALPAWGMVIPAGKTGDSPKVSGTFERGTRAYLRVYRGQHPNAELMAISDSSLSRATVMLMPGVNEFEVLAEGLRPMIVRRVGGQ
jgi:hypothetical protein